MKLADQKWTPISYHEMIHAFLYAEADENKWFDLFGREFNSNHHLITEANFSSKLENFFRIQLLRLIRGRNLDAIPASTHWFHVEYLMDDHLSELYLIAQRPVDQSRWDEPNASAQELWNKLIDVAKRCHEESKASPDKWKPLILWGHSKNGPFTIIEGNHRLWGYCSSNLKGLLRNRVIVGLSPDWCMWHRPDRTLVEA